MGCRAWGSVLPNEIVWDLVAYVRSISDAPELKEWGTTVSPTSPSIEQVPAELQYDGGRPGITSRSSLARPEALRRAQCNMVSSQPWRCRRVAVGELRSQRWPASAVPAHAEPPLGYLQCPRSACERRNSPPLGQ